jgi:hypothetical protein
MKTALTTEPTARSKISVPQPSADGKSDNEIVALTRNTIEGPFSLFKHGPFSIEAEPGLVIRVLAGCLWVPNHEEHCSVSVGAGEHLVARRAGELTILAAAGTQVRLDWPSQRQVAEHQLH